MLFMSDTRNGIARLVENAERDEVVAQWSALMQYECDNFESTPAVDDDRWLLNIEYATVLA